jgi:hypothetical protein
MRRLVRFSIGGAFDPFHGSKDIRVERKIIFPVCHSEKAAAFFTVHRPPDALCEKSQLLIRRLLTGPPVRLSPPFANPLLFLVRTSVRC